MPIQAAPATGTETVSVACKIPQGFDCTIHEKREFKQVTKGGMAVTEQSFPTELGFRLKGPARGQNEGPRVLTAGGFAITQGVDKALWDAWREQYKDHPAVKSGLIYSLGSSNKTIDAAKERKGMKTGLERLNPHDMPKIDPNFKVKTADENPSQIGQIEDID
jgi:hypothetical protein